ncbi:alpha/beta hydrolase [Ideonella sp. DXS22W]|uniref:Alpha/beta hydrolase n=1 Tax=Pseudaquabacterium inlustre TaxID=2984192 RepID=A0ABU9CI11_9BURK
MSLAVGAGPGPIEFIDIAWAGRPVRIEHQWIAAEDADAPLIVFLHEGLGSVAMWRDFPARLCAATGCRGLVYSRPGYGRSTPRAPGEAWLNDFMHRQAHEVLPALLAALKVDAPYWLFGHSDGGSIALLHAARWPERVAGTVVLAPHILVEDVSVASIALARTAYESTDLRSRLAKYHDDPDSAFWGWNDIWLHPAFRAWAIADELPTLTGPLLAIQGLDDAYGTLAQIRGIAERCPQTRLLELPACGHSPHKDQPQAVIDAVEAWTRGAV